MPISTDSPALFVVPSAEAAAPAEEPLPAETGPSLDERKKLAEALDDPLNR